MASPTSGVELVSKGVAIEVLHDEVVPATFLANLVDRDDIWMCKRPRCLGLTEEALQTLIFLLVSRTGGNGQLLEGDTTVHQGIISLVNNVVRPGDLSDDLVFAECGRRAAHSGAVQGLLLETCLVQDRHSLTI